MSCRVISVSGIVLVLSLILSQSALTLAEYQRPNMTGLAGEWHGNGRMCTECHEVLLGTKGVAEITCSSCHTHIKRDGIDPAVARLHDDRVCIRCHIGTKNSNSNISNVSVKDFHLSMANVACSECHTERDGEYLRPNQTACHDCHPGGPHVVHPDEKLGELCPRCHGRWGSQFIEEDSPLLTLQGYVTSGLSSESLSFANVSRKPGFVSIGGLLRGVLTRFISLLGGLI